MHWIHRNLSTCAVTALAVVAAVSNSIPDALAVDEGAIGADFAQKTFAKVDELVRKHFYDAKAIPVWQAAAEAQKAAILSSKNLPELDTRINTALANLKVSHTQFVTPNDETFFFLKALFASHNRKKQPPPPSIDYVGAITGGVTSAPNEVRYVLDGSPAQAAGIKIGDRIVTINGAPYIGQLSWKGTSGTTANVKLKGADETERLVQIKPKLANDYDAYVEAIGKSIRREKTPEGTIGYVHVWCGSEDAHEAIEEAIMKLHDTDALIFDLRDGYGGNFFNDLDMFYRPAEAYPPFTTVFRNSRKHTTNVSYPKPVVTLINGGSRSGKELLAYSLKKTGRSTLVGETTAGAVLAGRLYEINDKAALYLAVANCDVEGISIEGKGVSPDVEIRQTSAARGQHDAQYDEGLRILKAKLAKPH